MCPAHPEHALAQPETSDTQPSGPGIAGLAIDRVLGRGGFATVYLARRSGEDGPIALKVAHRRGDPRMAREAACLRRLGSPLAPALLGQGVTEDGCAYLLMEYVGDDSLAARLAARAAAVRPDLVAIAAELASMGHAIDRMHAAGLVHRDLKPENVLFRARAPGPGKAPGRAVLIDFGLARPVDDTASWAGARLTRTGEQLGTAYYMAPEQWHARGVIDPRTDLYALGVMLFEMLTGRPPFVGSMAEVRHGHAAGQCPRPSQLAQVPAAVDAVIERALAKDQEQRFPRALDLVAAFQLAMDRSEHGAADVPAPASAAPRPVAMLAVRTRSAASRLAEVAATEDALLAHVEGACALFALPWSRSPAAAVRAALRLAERLAPEAAMVHVAWLRVVQGRRGVRVTGPAARQPAAWAPYVFGNEPAPGPADLILSEAAARYLDAGDAVPAGAGTWVLARRHVDTQAPQVEPEHLALRGRDALVGEVITAVRQSLAARRPLLATLAGETGLGKTRVMRAIAGRLAEETDAEVVFLEPQRGDDPQALLGELVRAALGLGRPAKADVSTDVGAAVDAGLSWAELDAAWARLGLQPSPVERWAVALVMGAASRSAPALAPVLGTPGALRQAVARAVARALARRSAGRGLVVLVDDAHRADPTSLDVLELATMDDDAPGDDQGDVDGATTGHAGRPAAPAELAIVTAALPSLRTARARWGDRAHAALAMDLLPLDAATAHAVLRDLLHPVEFVPEPVLARLYEISTGVPLYLVELARALREGGALRQHGSMDGYFIAGDELLQITSTPLVERLAERALAGIPAPLHPLVDLCVLLNSDVSVAEVRAIQRVLASAAEPHAAEPLADIDAAAGLARLVNLTLLTEHEPGRYALRHPLLHQGLETRIPGPRRQALHAAILRFWQEQPGSPPGRVAHHAAHAGAAEVAAAAYLALADTARGLHHYSEAAAYYSQCLAHAADDALRSQALAGRGSMRYRLQRFHDALDDLRAARTSAEQRGHAEAAMHLLLEEATVLDWCQEWTKSAQAAEEAAARLARLPAPAPALRAGVQLAMGRTHHRRDQHAQAVDALERVLIEAPESEEICTIALLLLGVALIYSNRLDEAEARFAEVIARCHRSGDTFHLASAHINRQILWMKRQDVDRALADLRICVRLARQLGNAQLERFATFNQAELLFWHGDLAAAQALAERSRDLQLRFFREYGFHDDALLLARIACARGDAQARAHLDWLETHCDLAHLPASAAVLLTLVRLAASTLPGAALGLTPDRVVDETPWETPWEAPWLALADQARAAALLEESVEVLVTAAQVFLRCQRPREATAWLARARDAAAGSPLWQPHLTALERALAQTHDGALALRCS